MYSFITLGIIIYMGSCFIYIVWKQEKINKALHTVVENISAAHSLSEDFLKRNIIDKDIVISQLKNKLNSKDR